MSGGDLVLLGVLLIVAGHLSAKAEGALAHSSKRGVRGGEVVTCLLVLVGGIVALLIGLSEVLP